MYATKNLASRRCSYARSVSGPHSDFALDLHHPNGERIADLVLRPCPPTADRETLEGIRDAVLRAVSA